MLSFPIHCKKLPSLLFMRGTFTSVDASESMSKGSTCRILRLRRSSSSDFFFGIISEGDVVLEEFALMDGSGAGTSGRS